MKYIYTDLEKGSIWNAMTEFMRFEADAMHQINQNLIVNQNDIQEQKRMNVLYGDLEQLKLLAKIKLQENTEGFYNQFKSTGSNMYGSMGIGSEN